MLFPVDQILLSARRELAQLQAAAGPSGEGSALQSLGVALSLLAAREHGGGAGLQAQRQALDARLAEITTLLPAGPLTTQVAQMRARIARAGSGHTLAQAEAEWREIAGQAHAFAALAARAPALDDSARARIANAFIEWECADLSGQLSADAAAADAPSTDLTAELWRDYLRDRFNEPTLELTLFKSLAGGFGKQTFLFDVRGTAIDGSYVLRRNSVVVLMDNDCHRIEKEYALIRAAHGKGFPAPDAVWLDTEHRLVPGGHFLVMRRSPGVAGGSVFAAQGAVPPDLSHTLTGILARLHALPPLLELGDLSESISPALWELPIGETVRRYILGWHELFEREVHLPSPAMASLFGWLLEHIPQAQGRPSLLHGDIGFHNFLFDGGQLTAVLDWEFGHIGDPAEDLAYVRNTLGASLDWPAFMAAYRAAGGAEVSEQRLHFFQVWGHLRNACASNIVSAKFSAGQTGDLKVVVLPHLYIPQFLRAAQALVGQGSAA